MPIASRGTAVLIINHLLPRVKRCYSSRYVPALVCACICVGHTACYVVCLYGPCSGISTMPRALMVIQVRLHVGPRPRGLVHRSLVPPGPGCPLAPWRPPGPCPWPLVWALVLGFVSAGASFSVWRRVLHCSMLRVNRLSAS